MADPTPSPTVEAGAAAVIAVITSAALGAASSDQPWAPWAAGAVPALLTSLAGPSLREHPFPRLGLANYLTFARAVVVAGLAASLADPTAASRSVALAAVGAIAFALDGLDGRIARATGMSSTFGARLDMELDGLMVLVLCGLVITLDRVGSWVLLAGFARHVFIGAGQIWPFLRAPLPPTPRRAWACGVGVSALVAALLPLGAWSTAAASAGALALIGSFAVDVVWLWTLSRR